MKKFLIVLAVLLALAFGGGTYAILYTSAPFKAFGKLLAALKIDTEGMSGSLASGMQIEKLGFGQNENEFRLERFSFKYSGLWDLWVKKELNISEISVGKMLIRLHPKEIKTETSTESTFPSGMNRTGSGPAGLKIRVAKIDVENAEIHASFFDHPLQIEHWLLEDFRADDRGPGFTKFEIRSNALDLILAAELGDLNQSAPNASVKSIKAVLKPTFLKTLKAPVSFDGSLSIEDGKFSKPAFHVMAFDGKVNAKFDDAGLLVISFRDLNFVDYFNEGPTLLNRVNLNATYGPDFKDVATFKIHHGAFDLGKRHFDIEAESAPAKVDALTNSILVSLSAVSNEKPGKITAHFSRTIRNSSAPGGAVGETPFKVELTSEPRVSNEDLLSSLLFEKPYGMLTTTEKMELEGKRNAFKLNGAGT